MNNESGFIVLHRQIMDWEWYSDTKTFVVFLYLLLKANWKPNRWRGIEIGRGQTLETYPKIAKATGLSVQSVRTALFHLKSTGEITTESTGYGTLISITQYSKYQDLPDDINRQINTEINSRPTDDQQTINSTRTNITKKQSNNIVCEEYISNTESNQKHSFSPPTLADIESFVSENDLVVDPKYFFDYYESAGWKSDWKARLRRWDKEDRDKQSQPPKQQTNVVPMPSYMQKQKEEMLQQDEPKEKKRIVIDDWENLW